MNGFTDPYFFLLNRLSKWLKIFTPAQTAVQQDFYFLNRVTSFFSRKCFVIEAQVSSPIFYYKYNLVLKNDYHTLDSSGISRDKSEALLISQAELMERSSTWLPLDVVKKYNFSGDVGFKDMYHTAQSRSLLFLHTKRNSFTELYWGVPQKFVNATSSGTAGHFDKTRAVIKAWNELIERDAFLVHWLNTIPAKHIDVSQDKEIASLMEIIDKNTFTFHILDITSDVEIPTCLCIILYHTNGERKMFMGSATNFEGRLAILSAVKEACNVSSWLIKQEPLNLSAEYIPFTDSKINLQTRARLYLNNEGVTRAEFLWSSGETIALEDFDRQTRGIISPKKQLAYLKKIFRQKTEKNPAYDVYLYSYKNSLISTFGFKVVRVMCEALYPFYLTENFADSQHLRLQEFVKNKGLESLAKLNIFPHPFF
jgi:thiazole/oxazole-forming peptide maturase SagD family component